MLLGSQNIATRDKQGIGHRQNQSCIVLKQRPDQSRHRSVDTIRNAIGVGRLDHIRNLELGRTCDTSVPHGDMLTIRQTVGAVARQVNAALALTGAPSFGKLVDDVLLDERCITGLEEHSARLFGDNCACQI